MRWYGIPVVIVCAVFAVWFCVVMVYWGYGEPEKISPVGTALSPIGWMLTALAIMIGFKQRHDDAKRSHLDKLATAYAKWFEETWHIVCGMIDELDKALRQEGDRDIRDTLTTIYLRERELRTAATPLLMLEQVQERADRVRKTFVSLPSWGQKPITSAEVENYRAFALNFVALLRERRDDIENFFEDAGRAVSPTSSAK